MSVKLSDWLKGDVTVDDLGNTTAHAGSGGTFSAVASVNISAGTAVAIDRTTGKLVKGDPSYKPNSFVAGLLTADVLLGFSGVVALAQLTLADWTAITGSATLLDGQPYFLAASGGLTTTPPGSGCLVLVGTALNATTMQIEPQPPIQL